MSRRVVDVNIKSEFKRGFTDIANALTKLEQSLGNVGKLQGSINKLAAEFEKSNKFRQIANDAKKLTDEQKKLAQSTKEANAAASAGARIAAKYRTDYDKLGLSLAQVRAAQKTNSVNSKSALQAEIGLLNEYIKKTKDIGILSRNMRGDGGRFATNTFSKKALQAVQQQELAKAFNTMFKGFASGPIQNLDIETPKIISRIENSARQIKAAIAKIDGSMMGSNDRYFNRRQQQASYDYLFGASKPRNAPDYKSVIEQNTGITRAVNGAGDPGFAKLIAQYQTLENKAAETEARNNRRNFGPNPRNSESGFKKLFDQYNKLGHFLFQLQYSTYTLFGLTGLGLVAKQADEFITLRNQVARTSESIDDLGENMKTVMNISRQTFSDPKNVGAIYSRINSYRDQLQLSQKDVGQVTGTIAGAFAASPGNAQAKSAAQYQFIQAIQSNRLGGDELRSILEQAPFVADIVTKAISKVRGLPDGKVVDLRDKNNPVRTAELIKGLQLPEIRKEIFDTLGKQTRTFGDVMVLAKVRAMELTQGFFESTGIITKMVSGLTTFLTDDSKFQKFIQALQFATTALIIFGGTAAAQKIGQGLMASAESGLISKGFAGAAAGRTRGYALADAAGSALGGMAGNARKGVAGTLLKDASGLTNAFLAMVNPINWLKGGFNLLKTGVMGAGSAVLNFGKAIPGAFGALKKFNLGAMFKAMLAGIGPALRVVAGGIGALLGGLSGVGIIIALVIAAIAGLVLWFNNLLGKMTDGMNIMDILTGTWRMLMDVMGEVAAWLSNSFLGDIWRAITGFIEGILKFIGKAAKENTYFQQAQADRQYGGNDGKFNIKGKDGKIYQGLIRTDANGKNPVYDYARDDKGRAIMAAKGSTADVIWGNKVKKFQPDLPTGQSSRLPDQKDKDKKNKKTEAQRMAERFDEFLRDQYLAIEKAYELASIPDSMQSAQEAYVESFRKAADIFNIEAVKRDSNGVIVGVKTNAELIEEIGKKVPKATMDALKESADRLRAAELDKAFRDFERALTEELSGLKFSALKAALSPVEGQLLDARAGVIDMTLSKGTFDVDKFEAFKRDNFENIDKNMSVTDYIRSLPYDKREAAIKQYGDNATVGNYEGQQADVRKAILDEQVGSAKRSAQLSGMQLKNQAELLRYFGREREQRSAILDIQYKYNEQYGAILETTPEIQAAMREEIRLANEKYAIEEKYRSNWVNGAKAAMAEYKDSINDTAGQMQQVFSNAFQNLEDALVTFMNTGKADFSTFITSLLNDIQRMMVRQLIMKPIMGFLEKMFNIDLGNDMKVEAKNVYVNGSQVGGEGGTGQAGGKSWVDRLQEALGTKKDGETGGPAGESPSMPDTRGWFASFDSFITNLMGSLKNMTNGIGKLIGDVVSSIAKMFQSNNSSTGGSSGSSSGGGDYAWVGQIITMVASFFHEGGTVGAGGGRSKAVSASLFRNAKRYHTGVNKVGMNALASNEVPAILKMGETVLTVPQQHAITQKMNGAGGSSTTVYSPNISVNYTANGGSESSEEDAKRVSKMVQAVVRKEIIEFEKQKRKPGSLASF